MNNNILIGFLIEEFENQKSIKNREVDEWKSRYSTLEITLLEFKEKESIFIEYQTKISFLSTEVERLTKLFRLKDEEIYSLKTENNHIDIKNKEFQVELNRSLDIIKSRESEIINWKNK